MFWVFGHAAHGMLAQKPGIELTTPPVLEDEVPTTGPPGKSFTISTWAFKMLTIII